MTGRFDARAEIADSLRRSRAWRAEMQSAGMTRDEASRIASVRQQHEMWQIEQRLTAADQEEAERRIRDAGPGFQARERATWAELMAFREQYGQGFSIERSGCDPEHSIFSGSEPDEPDAGLDAAI